mmetsp:Transcript_47203/g.151511  ORF Transcript_47203/g.151511 Transcript_47203/m.151511 type:complete len:131 (+) Transcript_47203:637-1029(+)
MMASTKLALHLATTRMLLVPCSSRILCGGCASAFRCDRVSLQHLPQVSAWLARVHTLPGFGETVRGPIERGVGYFFATRWKGRALGNVVRLLDFALAELTGASSPGAGAVRGALYAALAWPLWLLQGILA